MDSVLADTLKANLKNAATEDAKLDAIDANGGYCPCQIKSASTKCHCADFRNKKAIGEPCICGIYVKQAKGAKRKGVK